MSAQRGNPEPEELIAAAFQSMLLNVRVAGIGIVKDYNASEKTCTVQPAIKRPIEDEDGALVFETDSLVQNVIVAQIGGFMMNMNANLSAGDAVLLVYLDFAHTLWRERGAVSDPAETTKHGPSYPIAVPFYRPSGGPGEDSDDSIGPAGGARVRFQGEGAYVRVGPTSETGAEWVALADKTNARLDALEDFALNHTHATAGTGPPVAAVPPFTPGGGDVSATRLKSS